jgi:WD40 repeat protein
VRAPALLAVVGALGLAPAAAAEGLKEVATLPYAFPVARAALSPDGKVLAAGGGDSRGGDLRLWDATTGKEIGRLAGYTDPLYALAFSADGKRLATAGQSLRVWDVQTRRELDTFKPPRADQAYAVGLSPDGQVLAAAGYQGVKVWDVASGRERISFRRLVHGSYYPGLAFSPDLRLLAAANYPDVDLWDTATGKLARVLSEHRGSVCAVAFSADGKTLASAAVLSVGRGGWKGEVRLWEVATGRERAALKGRFGMIRALALRRDGRTLALLDEPELGGDADLKLLDLATGRERVFRHSPDYPFVPSLCFAPDGRLLVLGTAAKGAKLWEVAAPLTPRSAP